MFAWLDYERGGEVHSRCLHDSEEEIAFASRAGVWTVFLRSASGPITMSGILTAPGIDAACAAAEAALAAL